MLYKIQLSELAMKHILHLLKLTIAGIDFKFQTLAKVRKTG